MRLDTSMSQRMEQKMILAPRMIQSMEILQLPVMALQEKIETELQENPFLEMREPSNPDDQDAVVADPEFNPDAPLKHDESGELEYARLEEMNRDWGDSFNEE